jgi:hypothetical protein
MIQELKGSSLLPIESIAMMICGRPSRAPHSVNDFVRVRWRTWTRAAQLEHKGSYQYVHQRGVRAQHVHLQT